MVGKALKNFDRNISITEFVAEDLGLKFNDHSKEPPPSEIKWMDPRLLNIPNFYEELYGTPSADPTLLLSIVKERKILEPIVVNQDNVIISGVKRTLTAIFLELPIVPVRVIDNSDPNPFDVVSHNIRNEKDNYTLFQEIRVLKPIYDPGQGYRSDLKGTKLKLDKFLGVKTNVVSRLWNIHLKCISLFGEDSEDYQKFAKKLKNDSIHNVISLLEKKSNEKAQESLQLPSQTKEHIVYPKSSLDPTEVSDQTIQSIIVSPPYYQMRNYKNGDNELGREKSVDEFVDNLVSIFSSWKRILKPDGCLVINISESSKGGDGYPMSIEKLVIKMPEIGYQLQHRLYWVKSNPVFDGAEVINNAVEHIYIFSKQGQKPKLYAGELDRDIVYYYGDDKILNVINGSVNQSQKIKTILKNKGFSLTHTSMMPEYLAEFLIQLTSKENDTILDGFNGIGTTGRIARELNRSFIGYEINEEYYTQSLILASETLKIAA